MENCMADNMICGMSEQERQSIIDSLEEMLEGSDTRALLIGGSTAEINMCAPAIIGLNSSYTNIVYDYQLLVRCFMEGADMTEGDALEWVEYNVVRSLPYQGSGAPILVHGLLQ